MSKPDFGKIVYGWVVDWNAVQLAIKDHLKENKGPNVTIDLFFSSHDKFKELLVGS